VAYLRFPFAGYSVLAMKLAGVVAVTILITLVVSADATKEAYLQLWGAGYEGGKRGPKLKDGKVYCPSKYFHEYTIKCVIPRYRHYKVGDKTDAVKFYVNGKLVNVERNYPFFIGSDNYRTGFVKRVRDLSERLSIFLLSILLNMCHFY
jgi:hypothetical protein